MAKGEREVKTQSFDCLGTPALALRQAKHRAVIPHTTTRLANNKQKFVLGKDPSLVTSAVGVKTSNTTAHTIAHLGQACARTRQREKIGALRAHPLRVV